VRRRSGAVLGAKGPTIRKQGWGTRHRALLLDREITVLRKLAITALLLLQVGCDMGANVATAKNVLPGRWFLNTETNCTYGKVSQDELIFYSNGTFDQHLRLPDRQVYDSTENKWTFLPRHNIALDSRWAFLAGAPIPKRESESLIVEFTHPPSIVIDPDNNCFYGKASE
jgi:hypothetical protein